MIPLRLAIVGCGAIARWHVDAAASVSGVEIACTVDVVPERAAAVAALAGATPVANVADAGRLADGGVLMDTGPHFIRALPLGVCEVSTVVAAVSAAAIEAAYRSLRGSGWERVEPVDGPTAWAVT